MLGKNQQGEGRSDSEMVSKRWWKPTHILGMTVTDSRPPEAMSSIPPCSVRNNPLMIHSSLSEDSQDYVQSWQNLPLSPKPVTGVKEIEFCHQGLNLEHNEWGKRENDWDQFRLQCHPDKLIHCFLFPGSRVTLNPQDIFLFVLLWFFNIFLITFLFAQVS